MCTYDINITTLLAGNYDNEGGSVQALLQARRGRNQVGCFASRVEEFRQSPGQLGDPPNPSEESSGRWGEKQLLACGAE